MKPNELRLLLVDDHQLFRKAVRMLLQEQGIGRTVTEAKDGLEAFDILSQAEYDLVMLDVQMPRMGGIEFLKKLRAQGSAIKVVMLTQFDDEALIIYLLQLGANGLLLKDCSPDDLKMCVDSVMKDGHYYDVHVVDAVTHNLAKDNSISNLNISPREFQVITLLKQGKSSKEMASHLGLTLRTVESYRKGLIKKTNCRNTLDLINLAYRTGLMPK